jgi:hypothetical protein
LRIEGENSIHVSLCGLRVFHVNQEASLLEILTMSLVAIFFRDPCVVSVPGCELFWLSEAVDES